MKNFNHYLGQVNEKSFKDFPIQLYHSKNNMRSAEGFNSKDAALRHAKEQDITEFDIFKNGSGFHSTTQEEYLVLWADAEGGGYWSNRAAKEPELMKKKYDIEVANNESTTFNVPTLIQLFYVEDANGKAVGLYKDLETAEKLEAQTKGKKHIVNIDRDLYNSGKINASNAKYHIAKNESGEIVPVQAGEIIKLQKPAADTFTDVEVNNDGIEIGNCSVCGAGHVVCSDHICKTVIDPNSQVPSEYNMTENRFESIRNKYGINETNMITKLDWFKNINEVSVINETPDSNYDHEMTPEDIEKEVNRLFDRYNNDEIKADIEAMFPDYTTAETEDAAYYVLDTIFDSEDMLDSVWKSIKPLLFNKFREFFKSKI